MSYIFKLAQMADVSFNSLANNDILKYNNSTSKWENVTFANSGLVSTSGLNSGRVALTGANNTITDSSAFTYSASTMTINTLSVTNDVTIGGNLTINGTTTTVNATTLSVDDPLIALADGNTADTVDLGFYGQYKPAGTTYYGGLFRDASDSGIWKLFEGQSTVPTTTVDTTGTYVEATLKVYSLLLTGITGSSSSTNYVVWNATSKALEYRSLAGGSMSSFNIADTDTATGGKDIADGQYLCFLGDGAALSSAVADGSTGHVKVTYTHSTAAGYKHIPAAGASNQYLQYASAGTAQWASFADLSLAANSGISMAGNYNAYTARTIGLDWGTGQYQVPAGNHTHTGLLSGGNAGKIGIWSSATAMTYDSNFQFDTTNFVFYPNTGQRWKVTNSITTSQSLSVASFIYNCTNSSSITLTIDTTSFDNFVGQAWYVKQSGTGSVIIATQSTQTIDGSSSDYTLPGRGVAVLLVILSTTAAIIL